MSDNPLEQMLSRYGCLPAEEMERRLRKDGFGDLLDMADEMLLHNPELVKLLSANFRSLLNDDDGDEIGVMSGGPVVDATPVDPNGTFRFDPQACLSSCSGACCKNRNYLMISIVDIYDIVTSPIAWRLGIESTESLFSREPPVVEIFHNQEYSCHLPYIRYLPVNAEIDTRPEDAPGSVCPFLRPMRDVYAWHERDMPTGCGNEAMGCALLEHKPCVCRLSPLGRFTGLTSGRISYEYTPPDSVCPACDTEVEIPVSVYVAAVEPPSRRELDQRLVNILVKSKTRSPYKPDPERAAEIFKQLCNIDGLTRQYGFGPERRPDIDRVVRIAAAAHQGRFGLYRKLVDELKALKKQSDSESGLPRTRPLV